MFLAQKVRHGRVHLQARVQFCTFAIGATWRSGKRSRRPLGQAGAEKKSSPFSPTPPTFLPYRPLSVNSVKGQESKNTFTVWDSKNGSAYLVDTGAEISVYPASMEDRKRATQAPLRAANSSLINTWGKRNIRLTLGKRSYWQEFILAEVTRPILGANFFATNFVLPDLARKRLLDGSEDDWASGTPGGAKVICQVSEGEEKNEFHELLNEFPSILTTNFHSKANKHKIFHYIPTSGPPVFAKPRRLDESKLASAKKYFKEMEELGIVRRSNSPWASPLHVVPKANGELRPCGDYRRLNQATVDDRYPLPHIHSFNAHLKSAKIFSKIDLTKGYHQIPMAEEDVPKTAIVTPFGLYEFLRMPFGWGAGGTPKFPPRQNA